MRSVRLQLNPASGNPQWLGLELVNRSEQLLESHGQVGVDDGLVEHVRVEELYPSGALQDVLELLVLRPEKQAGQREREMSQRAHDNSR